MQIFKQLMSLLAKKPDKGEKNVPIKATTEHCE